jgi:hypothetical protein
MREDRTDRDALVVARCCIVYGMRRSVLERGRVGDGDRFLLDTGYLGYLAPQSMAGSAIVQYTQNRLDTQNVFPSSIPVSSSCMCLLC